MQWLVFLFGLAVGSFLNVVIYRLPRDLGFVRGRSFCPKCKHKISWFDNVPLLSFVILKGRCRFCHSPISWRYPLVELTTALLTFQIFNLQFSIYNQFSIFQFLNLILTLILFWGLIAVFFIDLEHQIIPDEIISPLIIIFLLKVLLTGNWSCLLTAISSFLFFYLIFLITKGKGMGFGDVKLAFLMGLVLGFPKIIVAFYLAFLTGAFLGIILIIVGKAKLKQKIAFGPFLVSATAIAYLWGEKVIEKIMAFL